MGGEGGYSNSYTSSSLNIHAREFYVTCWATNPKWEFSIHPHVSSDARNLTLGVDWEGGCFRGGGSNNYESSGLSILIKHVSGHNPK